MIKKILIILCFCLLTACTNIDDRQPNSEKSITVGNYKPAMDGYQVIYSIDAYTKNPPEHFKSQNLLFVPNNEVINVTYGNASEQNSNNKIMMKVYYDYKLIDFKLTNTDKYISEYIFDLKDGKKIDLRLLLDNQDMKFDNNIHKLLVTFTTGADQNASDFDTVTDEYGINATYDLVHNLDYSDKLISDFDNLLIPTNNFVKDYVNLLFNTDYENTTQNSEYGGVINPPSLLKVKKGSTLPLMYNFNKGSSENALLILTLDFKQININGEYATLIKLDGKEGTANGKINIKVPDTPGKYEVIGYVVHNPFDKYSGGSNLAYSSYRFTLLVE